MITHSDGDEIYIGRGAGTMLKKDLDNAKSSIKIISPYLTASYVEDLLRLANAGVSVTLITSNEIKEGDGNYSSLSHKDLIKQERHTDEKKRKLRSQGMKYSLIALILPLMLLVFHSYFGFAVATIVIGIIFVTYYNKKIYSYSYYSPIKLKIVPDEYHDRENGKFFVHSKVYVIDERVAYVGSVNYTNKAFKYNYETITKVSSVNAVKDISQEVNRLFLDKDVNSKDIQGWGKELYLEPQN